MEQGMWAFIKEVFNKSCSALLWQRRNLRWPNSGLKYLFEQQTLNLGKQDGWNF
jgi:hypothetical protein